MHFRNASRAEEPLPSIEGSEAITTSDISPSGGNTQTTLNSEQSPPDEGEYPSGLKLGLLLTSLYLCLLLVSLDRMIISTAIPQITNQFHSAGDIGWYGTAYMITSCAFQLIFGKIYKVFSIKVTFLTSMLLFEVGSALCGAAPSSIAFILGRAIAGLGAGGMQAGMIVLIVYAVPLHERPKYQGFFGAVFGISSVAGPLVGGAFTTKVTWRWCFYLNLPVGGAAMLLVFLLLQIPDRPNTKIPLKEKLLQLNAFGVLALLPGVICLCLALQWGGTTYAWSEARIIVLLVLAFVLLIAFVLIQIWKPDQATIPPRILTQRSIYSGFWVSCCLGSHLMILTYYVPLWFQAIQGVSALDSGNHLLPMLLPIVVGSILAGFLTSRIGYYTPFLICGVCLTAIGSGLLTTLGLSTSEGQWIGYQIIYGAGMGFCSQAPNMAAQTVLPTKDVSIGASLMFFGQTLFGAVFTTVGQNVLDNQLLHRLTAAGVPGITAQLIQNSGATQLLDLIPKEYHAASLKVYNSSLRACFRLAVIMACLGIVGALAMEWRSVKKNLRPKDQADQRVAEEGKGPGDSVEMRATITRTQGEIVAGDTEDRKDTDKDSDTVMAPETPEHKDNYP